MARLLLIFCLVASAFTATVALDIKSCRDQIEHTIQNVTTQYEAARNNQSKAQKLMYKLRNYSNQMIEIKNDIASETHYLDFVEFLTRFEWILVEKRACSFSWIMQNYMTKEMDDLSHRHMHLASGRYDSKRYKNQVDDIVRRYPTLSNITLLEDRIKSLDKDIHALVEEEQSDLSSELVSQLEELYQKTQNLYLEWEVLFRVEASVAYTQHQYFPIQFAIDSKYQAGKFYALSQLALTYKNRIGSSSFTVRLSFAAFLVWIFRNLCLN